MTPEIEKYVVKPIGIVRDVRLTSTEADYLCLIAGLEKNGGCVAGNQYFAEYFGVKRTSAVEVIVKLKRKGFIATVEKKTGGKTVQRTITVIDADSRKCLLLDSRESLPMDSRQNPSGIVGKTDFDSRQNPNHKLKVIIKYNSNTKKLENIAAKDLELWGESYPGLNIEREIRKMESWLDANPNRRPKSNYRRFINGWLSRARPDTNDGVCATRIMDEYEADELFRKAGIAQ